MVRSLVIKVSVIVPVYNPGKNIKDLLRTVLGQSLPADEYEVIFVDDGSTDATPARLDELAAEHDNVRVEHTPNSGWPGRPRNIGTDMARGEYVLYVDNDDYLGMQALERLYAKAKADDADVVIGKVVGHGKDVARAIFAANRSGVGLDWEPLVTLLSPLKLVRRAFLDEHRLRFPEGRRRLEDHVFMIGAYVRTRRVSVLADYPCYHWVRRRRSASFQRLDPVGYYPDLEEVLDILDEHVEPGELRDRLYSNWYRGKLLRRVGGPALLRRTEADEEYSRELFEEIRRVAERRFGPAMEAHLPFHLRVRSHLLRTGSFEGVIALAAFESQLEARAIGYPREHGNGLALRLDLALRGTEQPLIFERDGDEEDARVRWVPPPGPLREILSGEVLDATADFKASRPSVFLRSPKTFSEYPISTKGEARLITDGTVAQAGDARLNPSRASAGSPLRGGSWEVHAVAEVCGFSAGAQVARRMAPEPMLLRMGKDRRLVERRPHRPPAPPPVPPALRQRVVGRVPGGPVVWRALRGGRAHA
jgi:glycosyltransferase involved in cell wall biosynthesis